MQLIDRTHIPSAALGIVAAASLAIAPAAWAVHADIELGVEANQIIVDPDDEALVTTRVKPDLKLFEAEFFWPAVTPFTGDPGFNGGGVDDGFVAFRISDNLLKWDTGSSTWVDTGFDEFIRVEGFFPADMFDVSSSAGDGSQGTLAQVAGGGVHAHLDFGLHTTGAGAPTEGAYLLELELLGFSDAAHTTPTNDPSDAFLIAFHLDTGGFGEESFENAVDALTAVPVPAALPLLAGALAMGWVVRRRRHA